VPAIRESGADSLGVDMKRFLPGCMALLLIGGAFGQQKKSSGSKKRVLSMEQMIRDAGLDLRNLTEESLRKVGQILRKEEKKGIWLVSRTPLAIDRDRDTEILGFDYYSTQDRGRRYLSESGVVVATRVESRETFAALINEPKEPVDPAAKPDTRPIPPSVSLQRFEIPLNERLPDLPWRAGTYLVDVMLDTETSNRWEFKLSAGAAAEKDPAVAAYIEAQRAATGPPKEMRPAPSGNKYPNYQKTAGSLDIPATNGITLSADRVSVYKPDGHSILKGSFRLPVPAGFYRAGSGDNGAATAAVPITLVMTGNILTGPFVSALFVPSYDKIDRTAAESVVTGQFEVDLFALEETSKVPQTYTIWAYSGAIRSAPATAAFITPEMLK
jgi:hypothetical protein